MNRQDPLKRWLDSNSWNLLVTIVSIVIAFSILRAEVTANTKDITVLKESVSAYPSVGYFELKFDTQDDKLLNMEKKIDKVDAAVRQLEN